MIEFRTGVAIRTTHLNEQPTTKYDRNKRKEDKMPVELNNVDFGGFADFEKNRAIDLGKRILNVFPKIIIPMLKEKTIK